MQHSPGHVPPVAFARVPPVALVPDVSPVVVPAEYDCVGVTAGALRPWVRHQGPAAVGDRSSTGNSMAGATSTASPYCAVLRGAPWSGSGLIPGELGPEAHGRTSFSLCASTNVPLGRLSLSEGPC